MQLNPEKINATEGHLNSMKNKPEGNYFMLSVIDQFGKKMR